MKKVFALFLTISIVLSCSEPNEKNFKISGTLSGLDEGELILQKRGDDGYYDIDTAILKEGKFEFVMAMQQPEAFYLKIDEKRPLVFLAGDDDIIINADIENLKEASISGSIAQDQYNDYKSSVAEFDERSDKLYDVYKEARKSGETRLADSLEALMDEIYEEKGEFIKSYIANNSSSYAGPYVVSRNLYRYELPELTEIVDNIDTSLNEYVYVKKLNDRIEILKSVEVGQPAKDFAMEDTAGNSVNLNSFRGKYVLVDFWASWCGPCRRENPNVVAVYNDYKDKGFDVLGVSLDKNKEAWLEAIDDDDLTWTHVSELTGWKSSAGKLYGVLSIPSNVLVDPDGIIVARNLREEALREKVSSFLDKQ
jgi:peroxiredoxin